MKKKKADAKKKPISSPKKTSNKTIQAKKPHDTKIETVSTPKTSGNSFPIAGMCASAGGLEAFEQFFRHMPKDSGIGFILVPHLDPTHKSIMVDLIKRWTDMEVVEARDGVKVQPNCIYVIPPNNDLAVLNGSLQLLEPVGPRGQRHPIDYFLRTLAKDQGEKAICVILSGTGTDGTLGLKAIKGEGGMVMVQDPITAKYDGMPRSAIETNMVDYIVPANKMPEQMIKYVQHSNGQAVKKEEALIKVPDSLQKIFILLRSHTGHDFSLYKKNTIIRRVERRMSVHQIGKIADYLRYMQEHRRELDLLFKEIIIGVTNFFRDKEAFAALKTKICPHLFSGKSSGDYVRIWVVVCSTGEEAYSIAMVFREYDLQVAIYMRRQSKRVNEGLRSSATFA
jgi:two-component system CheB/CheR fusion protein